ncbi:MAG TPA: hypothetical protein VHF88_03345 [Thermoleophilaceae bacterium]|nr:hypothetical protein [Thermoleophilaceae bacterium]
MGAIADPDESNLPGAGMPQATEIDPEAREAMAVLDRPREAADAMSPDLAERIDARADFGMNPGLSRLSIGNATNSVYVIPANGHVCAALTVGEGANLSCRSNETIAGGKAAAATVVLETRDIAIYGIVPDGVESVSVHSGASEPSVVPTEGNAYYTVVPAGTPLKGVSYAGPSGPVEFPLYDPSRIERGS